MVDAHTELSKEGTACRLYTDRKTGLNCEIPPVEDIINAFKDVDREETLSICGSVKTGGKWKRIAASSFGFVAAVLPVGFCPSCWPVDSGIVSALGLGLLLETEHQHLFIVILLLVSAATLIWANRRRKNHWALCISLTALITIYVGKLILMVPTVFDGEIAPCCTNPGVDQVSLKSAINA